MADRQQDEWLERVLGVTIAGERVDRIADAATGDGATADPDEDEDAPVDDDDLTDIWANARQSYMDASDEVDGQIGALQQALRQSDDLELEEIADAGLNGITGNTKVPLMAAIRDIGDGSRARMIRGRAKLLKAVQAFRGHLDSDERIEACDDNPFGVSVSIRDTFSDALDQLEAAVERA